MIEFANNQQNPVVEQVDAPISQRYESNLRRNFYLKQFEYKWNLENEEAIEEFLTKHNRRFTFDLDSNLFYSKSKLIDLLIQSDVSKYCEFKLIRRLLTYSFDESEPSKSTRLEQIPTSRSDIFKSTKLSMIEKRLLMKFFSSCVEESSELPSESIKFENYLEKFNLTSRLRDYILNAIAMCPANLSAAKGIEKCKKYFKSIGRYGDSPFLFQIYGTNELSQAFSRLSAVFGGIFYLNLELCEIKSAENRVDGIVVNLPNEKARFFRCKTLISNINYLNYEIIGERYDISKCILITNKSFFNDDDNSNEVGLLKIC